ncbi:MAG TPA: hypothetical protein VLA62_11535 [Solirubrobacterales bacterium]|nr:hypothetical protein [Solirubrobacterales bacterium]
MRRIVATLAITAALALTGLAIAPEAGADVGARLAAVEAKLAKVDVLEVRVAALEARAHAPAPAQVVYAPAPATQSLDPSVQISQVLNTAITIQGYKQVMRALDDRPRGFFAALTGEDGGGGFGGLAMGAIILKALGGALTFGF